MAQAGSLEIPVVPVYRGFRRTTDVEVAAAEKSASSILTRGFTKAGQDAGAGFAKSFGAASSASTAKLTAEVAKAAREVSAARLREQDAAGRVRVAETQLNEARSRFAANSSQVVRAEERLQTAQRGLETTQASLLGSTNRLANAQKDLTAATASAATSGAAVQTRFNGAFDAAGRNSAGSFSTGFRNAFPTIFGGALLANVVSGSAFAIGQGIGTAINAGISYTFDSIGLASEFQQQTGAVQAIFGGADAQAILNFASTAAQDVGLARQQYQGFAAVVGAQLKNLGVPLDQVVGRTDDLITLGADLSAQFGGSTADAITAISSLLRGERDPIERYAVSLKQVDIDARKAELGLSGLTDEADKQATILATLDLLYEQTASSQGRFAAEADTFAGKQQRFDAALLDAQTKFGEELLPVATDVLGWASTTLLPALDGVLGEIGPQIAEALEDAAPEIQAAFKQILKAAPGAVDIGTRLVVDGLDLVGDPLQIILGKKGTAVRDAVDKVFRNVGEQVGDRTFEEIVDGVFDADKYNRAGNAFSAALENPFEPYKLSTAELKGTTDLTVGYLFDKWDNYQQDVASELLISQNDFSAYNNSIQSGLKESADGAYLVGLEIPRGFARGIDIEKPTAVRAVKSMADEVVGTMRTALQIASPSKVFEQLGAYSAEGYAKGLTGGQAQTAVQQMLTLGRLGSNTATAAASGPTTLVIVDADRQLIGRMQVEADGRIARADQTTDQTIRGGVIR